MKTRFLVPLTTFASAMFLLSASLVCAQTTPKDPKITKTKNVKKIKETKKSTSLTTAELTAPLFEKDRIFTYQITSTSIFWDDEDPKADEQGNVTTTNKTKTECKVTNVYEYSSGKISEVLCKEGADMIDGVYLINKDGLFKISYFMTEEPDFKTMETPEPILPAVLAITHTKKEYDEMMGEEHSLEESGGIWCKKNAYWGGDESNDEICFSKDEGIIGTVNEFSGGSTQTTTVELITKK